ncbi:MAG: hypothetical protein H0V18_12000 [Pyrinomonadaceae bacterium]|nr:hypothetical protein [Pyrinomonadaceae bacterium]
MLRDEKSIALKPSLQRFALSFVCAVPAAGAALSSVNLSGVMRGVENAESSGLLPVATGIANSNLPVLIALYLGIFGGVLAILLSAVRSSKIALSPPARFLFGSALSLFAVLVLWRAKSMLIMALPSSREGVVAGASTIKLWLTLSQIGGVISIVVLLVGSIFRMASGPKQKWSPVAALLLVVIVFLFAAIAFQIRNSWLRDLYLQL